VVVSAHDTSNQTKLCITERGRIQTYLLSTQGHGGSVLPMILFPISRPSSSYQTSYPHFR